MDIIKSTAFLGLFSHISKLSNSKVITFSDISRFHILLSSFSHILFKKYHILERVYDIFFIYTNIAYLLHAQHLSLHNRSLQYWYYGDKTNTGSYLGG